MAQEDNNATAKLLEGIAYFEKMRQAMPDDRTTLEFLAVAYGQLDEQDKCCDAMVDLAGVLIKERDIESAMRIAERLELYDNADARAIVLKIKALSAPLPDMTPEEISHEGISGHYDVAVKAEVSLIKTLLNNNIIDSTLAESLTTKISAPPGEGKNFLVSALHFIEKENSSLCENVIAFMADTALAPPVPIDAFDIPRELLSVLPESYMRIRGVIPFAKLYDTYLVALLNPLDDLLKRECEAAIAGPCKFFTSDPSATETLLEKLFTEE